MKNKTKQKNDPFITGISDMPGSHQRFNEKVLSPSHFLLVCWNGMILIIVTDTICCMLIRV